MAVNPSAKNPAVQSSMIPIVRPDLGPAEAEAARAAVLSGWVTQGPQVAAFEAEFADYVGAKHAVAVSNCTTALHLALLGAGVGTGDEVVTVSHSFIATANAIRHCGAVPIFVDIDPATFNMDPAKVAEAITVRTRAILCVHQMGMPCDVASILKIAHAHNLPVVEDAACAIGSVVIGDDGKQQPIGRPHGQSACFSLHPRKVVTTGDGGMITTNDDDLARKFKLWRQHGMSIPDTVRHGSSQIIFEDYPVSGFNYRMTDVQAAIGRPQLARLGSTIAARRALEAKYRERLTRIPGLRLPLEPAYARSNWQSYCVRLPTGCVQRRVMQLMLDAGIATRRGIMCAHREGACSDIPLRHDLAQSEAAQDTCVLLPLFPGLTEAEMERIADGLSVAIAAAL